MQQGIDLGLRIGEQDLKPLVRESLIPKKNFE